jgi:hypothetical protein
MKSIRLLVPGVVILLSVRAFAGVTIQGNNDQQVDLGGGAINAGAGRSEMNIGSIKGNHTLTSNRQRVSVTGVVLNAAAPGGVAKTNIGSLSDSSPGAGSNQQTVSIRGAAINVARPGSKSELNIGQR